MTDRYHSFVVVLKEDVYDEDAQPILNALRQIKGVIKVTPNIGNVDMITAEARLHLRWIRAHQKFLLELPSLADED